MEKKKQKKSKTVFPVPQVVLCQVWKIWDKSGWYKTC